MRAGLTAPALRPSPRAAIDDNAGAVIAICVIGLLTSFYFALQVLTVSDLGVIYSEAFWG